jgi:hypothetical protein
LLRSWPSARQPSENALAKIRLAVKRDFANARYGLANPLATQGRLDEARARLYLLFRAAEMRDVR